jgi:hypothetical protein
MSRPVAITRMRAGIVLLLIALAGRRLLWPLIPIVVGIAVLIGVIVCVVELLD